MILLNPSPFQKKKVRWWLRSSYRSPSLSKITWFSKIPLFKKIRSDDAHPRTTLGHRFLVLAFPIVVGGPSQQISCFSMANPQLEVKLECDELMTLPASSVFHWMLLWKKCPRAAKVKRQNIMNYMCFLVSYWRDLVGGQAEALAPLNTWITNLKSHTSFSPPLPTEQNGKLYFVALRTKLLNSRLAFSEYVTVIRFW